MYKYNHGRLTVCGDCVDAFMMMYRSETGDDLESARRVCMKFDVYWDPALFMSATRSGIHTTSAIRVYLSRMGLAKYKGKTFDDSLKIELANGIATYAAPPADKKERVIVEATPEDIDFWGTGFSDEEYMRLNKKYSDWTSVVQSDEPLTLGEQTLYRTICILETTIDRNAAAGKPVEASIKQLNDLLGEVNAKPKQKKITDESDEAFGDLPFGVGIRVFENERPVPKPLPEFDDVDGVRKYVTVWFFGHLCHMLHIKNSYCKMYEEEMERLRVERPELSDEEDDDFLSDIFGGDGQ